MLSISSCISIAAARLGSLSAEQLRQLCALASDELPPRAQAELLPPPGFDHAQLVGSAGTVLALLQRHHSDLAALHLGLLEKALHLMLIHIEASESHATRLRVASYRYMPPATGYMCMPPATGYS